MDKNPQYLQLLKAGFPRLRRKLMRNPQGFIFQTNLSVFKPSWIMLV